MHAKVQRQMAASEQGVVPLLGETCLAAFHQGNAAVRANTHVYLQRDMLALH